MPGSSAPARLSPAETPAMTTGTNGEQHEHKNHHYWSDVPVNRVANPHPCRTRPGLLSAGMDGCTGRDSP